MLTILIFPVSSNSHDLVWPGEKLKALFPHAENFEQKNLYVSDEQRVNIEKAIADTLQEEDLKPSIYFAFVRSGPNMPPRKTAAIIFMDAYGDGGKIEIGVVVSGKGDLAGIQIFENKESQKLLDPSFLQQFDDKKKTDSFTVGSDIKAPAGLNKPAQSIANAAKRGVLIINEMFRKR